MSDNSTPKTDSDHGLEPIEDAFKNLTDQGMDKFQAATELKAMGYKVKDIARTSGVSTRDVAVKLSGAQNANTDQASQSAAEQNVLETVKKDVVARAVKDVRNSYSLGELLKSLDKRAYDAGFDKPTEYVEVATDFFDLWAKRVAEKVRDGELQHPLLEIASVN